MFVAWYPGTRGKSQMRRKSGKIKILRRNGSSGRQLTKIQLILGSRISFRSLDGLTLRMNTQLWMTSSEAPKAFSGHTVPVPAQRDTYAGFARLHFRVVSANDHKSQNMRVENIKKNGKKTRSFQQVFCPNRCGKYRGCKTSKNADGAAGAKRKKTESFF